jgi:hypothetical protein
VPPDVEVDTEAVEKILGGEFQRQGLMLSRFVLITEQVDSDGRRSLNVDRQPRRPHVGRGRDAAVRSG